METLDSQVGTAAKGKLIRKARAVTPTLDLLEGGVAKENSSLSLSCSLEGLRISMRGGKAWKLSEHA